MLSTIGESMIATYNDDDIYRMNCIDHARPHVLENRSTDQTPPVSLSSTDDVTVLNEDIGYVCYIPALKQLY